MNIFSGTINASSPANALATTSTAEVVAANNNRQGLIITNLSTGTVYLGLGADAVLKSGIVLLPEGGAWAMSEYEFYNGAINAIAHATGSILSIQEFTR